MENRINYIDRMKGFTILIVVLAHVKAEKSQKYQIVWK